MAHVAYPDVAPEHAARGRLALYPAVGTDSGVHPSGHLCFFDELCLSESVEASLAL